MLTRFASNSVTFLFQNLLFVCFSILAGFVIDMIHDRMLYVDAGLRQFSDSALFLYRLNISHMVFIFINIL